MKRKKESSAPEPAKKTAAKAATKTTTKSPGKPAKKKAAATAAVQTLRDDIPKPPAADVHEIIEQLRRGDLASRAAAARTLGELGDAHAASALAEALRDPTAELACEAAAALGKLTDLSALHALIAVVLNSDGYFHSTVRTAAATSLGNLLDPRAIEALAAAICDPICETSLAAIDALGKIGDPRVRPALEAAISNVDGFFLQQVQQAAADAILLLRD
jgi:HEAT repeat protein